MTSVKSNRKELIERIRKNFESQIGKKLTNQQILDQCLEFSNSHIEELIALEKMTSILTPEKKKRIQLKAGDYGVYYSEKSDDELLYKLKQE